MRDCNGPTWASSTPPDTAVRFTGSLQRVYCPLRTCPSLYQLSAQYPVDGATLSTIITRLDDGDRLQVDLRCHGNGYVGHPTLNGTRVEAGRLEWSRASINEEHGWFNYREQLLGGGAISRQTWKGEIDCEEARLTLTVNEEYNDLVPTLNSSGGVTVSVESCMRDCHGPTWALSTPPDTAVRFTGSLQREYCPLRTCTSFYRLSAQYHVDGVMLHVTITRLDDGDRLQVDLGCVGNGYVGRPTLNGTRVEAGRLEWSRASIVEEHGWFTYREHLVGGGIFIRQTWKGEIDCEENTLTTITHTSTTEANPTTVSGRETSTSSITANPVISTKGSPTSTGFSSASTTSSPAFSTAASSIFNTSMISDYRRTSPQPERPSSLVPLAALAAVPVLVGVVLISIFIRRRSLTKASQSSSTCNRERQPRIYENTSASRPGLETLQYENIAANRPADKQPQDQSDDRTGTYASLSDERNEGGHEYSSLTVSDPTAIYYNIK